MRGLIVDYCGVLDGPEEDQARWRSLLSAARNNGVATAVLSNDPGGSGAEPIRELEYHGIVDAVVLSGEIGADKPDPPWTAAWLVSITSSLIELWWK